MGLPGGTSLPRIVMGRPRAVVAAAVAPGIVFHLFVAEPSMIAGITEVNGG